MKNAELEQARFIIGKDVINGVITLQEASKFIISGQASHLNASSIFSEIKGKILNM